MWIHVHLRQLRYLNTPYFTTNKLPEETHFTKLVCNAPAARFPLSSLMCSEQKRKTYILFHCVARTHTLNILWVKHTRTRCSFVSLIAVVHTVNNGPFKSYIGLLILLCTITMWCYYCTTILLLSKHKHELKPNKLNKLQGRQCRGIWRWGGMVRLATQLTVW